MYTTNCTTRCSGQYKTRCTSQVEDNMSHTRQNHEIFCQRARQDKMFHQEVVPKWNLYKWHTFLHKIKIRIRDCIRGKTGKLFCTATGQIVQLKAWTAGQYAHEEQCTRSPTFIRLCTKHIVPSFTHCFKHTSFLYNFHVYNIPISMTYNRHN